MLSICRTANVLKTAKRILQKCSICLPADRVGIHGFLTIEIKSEKMENSKHYRSFRVWGWHSKLLNHCLIGQKDFIGCKGDAAPLRDFWGNYWTQFHKLLLLSFRVAYKSLQWLHDDNNSFILSVDYRNYPNFFFKDPSPLCNYIEWLIKWNSFQFIWKWK